MATRITYTDKTLGQSSAFPVDKKWRFEDANEVKDTVNAHADDIEANTSSIASIANISVDITGDYILPTIVDFGTKLLILSNRSGSTWVLSAFGGETIEGLSEVNILNNETFALKAFGTNWRL